MGKKGNTPAERERIRQAAAERRAEKENKQFKVLVIALVCVVAVAALIWIVNGALTNPAEIDDLNEIQDNWVVIDTDKSVSKRYHHPADFDVPAGYTLDEFNTANDKYLRSFLVKADSEDAPVEMVHVSAQAEWTPDEYIQNVIANSVIILNPDFTCEAGEPFTATIAGDEARCVYLKYAGTLEGEPTAYGCLYMGFDAPKNVCVYAVVSGAYTTPENVQTADALVAEAQTLLSGLHIIK